MLHEGEAEASTTSFGHPSVAGAEKPLKHAAPFLRTDPDSAIVHGDQYTVSIPPDILGDVDSQVALVPRILDGVLQQVDQHLSDRIAIRRNHGQRFLHRQVMLEAVVFELRAIGLESLPNDLRYVGGFKRISLAFGVE